MQLRRIVGVALLALGAAGWLVAAETPALTTIEALQFENVALKLRLLELTCKHEQDALQTQAAQVQQTISAAHPGYRLDLTTGRLVAVEVP